ncbi:MAG TPA: ABC transporter permease [Dehalococcoidia bacterium]|nr:ABC transporter permease [Dehalococcoidia bacterium]
MLLGLSRFAGHRGASVGVVVFAVLLIVALAAPLLARQDPLAVNPDARLLAPSGQHLFGTDQLGRDQFSRVVYGTRVTLMVGIVPVLIAAAAGMALGLTSGYFRGAADALIMRCIDVMMAFPGLLLALAVIAVLGPDLRNLMISVGIFSIPLYTRVLRGSTLSTRENLHVDAARAIGCGHLRIIIWHILPNVIAPLIVLSTLGMANAILVAASLSFLGLGQRPPAPEWGSMLSSARNFLRLAWWMTAFPGLAISISVLAINLIGDGLRDVLDPRLRT